MRRPVAGLILASVLAACGPNREALKEELRQELREELLAELRNAQVKPAAAVPTDDEARLDEVLAEAEQVAAPARSGVPSAALDDEEPAEPDTQLPPREDPPLEDEPPPIRVAAPEPPAERPLDDAFLDQPAAAPPGRTTPPAERPIAEAPAAKAPAAPSEPAAADPLEVKDFVLAEDVDREQRSPVRPGKRFRLTQGKLYAYATVRNPGPDTKATIEWLRSGEVKSRLELKVGHSMSGWRTWSTLKLDPDAAGQWTARLVDRGGRVLKELPFTVR